MVGSKAVQLGEDNDVPNMPRYARYDCGCNVLMPMASPPTWKSVPLSELDGVAPPQGDVSSLSMLLLRGGGVLTTKCAKARGVKARPKRVTSLEDGMMDYGVTKSVGFFEGTRMI